MAKPSSREMALARQARLAGLVMAVTIVAWVVLGWMGREFGWDPRYAFLIDFSALAAFVWALIVTFRVWRQGKADK
ncbi:MAG: hypothetical protein EA338_03540 [Roseinatronobacter sp.]|jgi:hypothetical protein|uniref:DUF5337 domain-containing protein n=1 Tax=Roseinatronobacter monicus TaxID=393481 RepID=A0A543KD54_9RHOB|nr:DUF5337 domain-containing protein [Roseinatronobacter monicus]TQM93015.1 hypothetical protein BD293_1638 [Roseinatronobacter monicus]TVQ02299.1 MAG: hypothetical protein EA338_03540 [Roseinatronobacter sp.]